MDPLRSMSQVGFIQELVQSIAARGRRMLDFSARDPLPQSSVAALCEGLLSTVGEASGVAVGEKILDEYAELDAEERVSFFRLLREQFGIDAAEVVVAAELYRGEPTAAHMRRLQEAVEPRRQELLRRLNLSPHGTLRLVRMREQLLELLPDHPDLREVDFDFLHLFQSWFNRGFLELRRIDWRSPAVVLEKFIKYEAVHQISDWDELRRRIDPADRRLYAFFHPRLEDEPLIFVEVALTADPPSAIRAILSSEREQIAPEAARTAVFYSISNCQVGLRGVSFGNFLIKQVVEDLRRELPGLKTFVTLSPVPGFARWLAGAPSEPDLPKDVVTASESTAKAGDPAAEARRETLLLAAAAYYLTRAKNQSGAPLDPVARFHLGNGARLERINFNADLSPAGLGNAHGIMVNYAYRPGEIERNHEMFANAGTIPISSAVARHLKRVGADGSMVQVA